MCVRVLAFGQTVKGHIESFLSLFSLSGAKRRMKEPAEIDVHGHSWVSSFVLHQNRLFKLFFFFFFWC